MEEPKRRARRMQQAQPEEQPSAPAEPAMEESAPPRRRRMQPALPQEQMETTEPPEEQQPEIQRRKKPDFGRVAAQATLGLAALLAMAGAAAVRAAKKIASKLCHSEQNAAEHEARRKKRLGKAQINQKEILRLAAMAVCTCVAVVSAWQVGSIVLRSLRTKSLNASLAQQRQEIIETRGESEKETQAAFTVFTPAVQQDAGTSPEMEPQSTAELQPEPEPQSDLEEQPAPTAVPDVVQTTKYHRVGGEALPEMAQLHGQNHDLVAWLQIPDVLDLPVVYRDNSYYLTRDFTKQKNASGTIFLDENHPFKEKTQNLLLHGHNMKDGTMFGRLAQYLTDDTYLRNHPIIYFDTLWQKEQYVIFAVLDVSLKPGDTRFFNYFTHDTFASDTEFSMYIRQLQLRSRYAIPIDVEPADALLTLSTCLDDDRLVIVARRLREGETRSQLRTLIRMATKQ